MAGSIYVPPVIGMSDLVVAAVDASTYARSRAQLRCDGDDDQDQINEALEAGGHVRLTDGTFLASDSVILPTKTWLSGVGGSTIIRAIPTFADVATAHSTLMYSESAFKAVVLSDPSGDTTENVFISDLEIDGNSDNQTVQAVNICGLLLVRTQHSASERVYAHDVCEDGVQQNAGTRQFAIATSEAFNCELRHCRAANAGYEALAIRDESRSVRVFGGSAYQKAVKTIHVAQISGSTGAGVADISIIGLHVQRPLDATGATYKSGFFCHSQSDLKFLGCSFQNAMLTFSDGCTRVGVGGCQWYDFVNVTGGIYFSLGGVSHVRIANNTIVTKGNGISFAPDADPYSFITISDNRIEAVDRAIHFVANSTVNDCTIRGNTTKSGGTYNGIQIDGTTNRLTIEDNPDIAHTGTSCISLPAGKTATGLKIRRNTLTNGRSIDIEGTAPGLVVQDNRMSPSSTAMRFYGTFENPQILGNTILSGSYGLHINNAASLSGLRVEGNDFQYPLADANKIYGTPPADSIIRDNIGRVTRATGTATVANGATYATVTHGMAYTPTRIEVTPTNSLGDAVKYWVSDIGATTFRINVNADPGATTATFNWDAGVYGA